MKAVANKIKNTKPPVINVFWLGVVFTLRRKEFRDRSKILEQEEHNIVGYSNPVNRFIRFIMNKN